MTTEDDAFIRAVERERYRVVSPHTPQRDRTRPRIDPDPQGPSRLAEAAREARKGKR